MLDSEGISEVQAVFRHIRAKLSYHQYPLGTLKDLIRTPPLLTRNEVGTTHYGLQHMVSMGPRIENPEPPKRPQLFLANLRTYTLVYEFSQAPPLHN